MQVEIWTDIYCPWCYLGKRRFERALTSFEHRSEVKVTWRSFQLDPGAPKEMEGTLNELLMKKYGMTAAQAEAAHDRLTQLGAEEGLTYRFDRARPGNSLDAHRLVHYAAQKGLADAMEERLFRAYFTEGEPLGDRPTMVRLAVEVGLEPDAVSAMLQSDDFIDAVHADQRRAQELGIRGVPAFVVDNQMGLSGAQNAEVFLRLLREAWQQTH